MKKQQQDALRAQNKLRTKAAPPTRRKEQLAKAKAQPIESKGPAAAKTKNTENKTS